MMMNKNRKNLFIQIQTLLLLVVFVACVEDKTPKRPVDKTSPYVVSVKTTKANGTYRDGEVIDISLKFSEVVQVTGSPYLVLNSGGKAYYLGGSGTFTLVFRYTVLDTENSTDLGYSGTSSLSINGGTIKDGSLNQALTSLPSLGSAESLDGSSAVVIDTTEPTVTSVTSTTTNGTYKAGDTITLTVTYSEPVVVVGTMSLKLETGTNDTSATYTSGSGTNVLTFTYTVVSGDNSLDLAYHSTSALSFGTSLSTLKDVVGNTATLTLPDVAASTSLDGSKSLVIDTTVPTVTNLTSAKTNGTYTTGESITLQIDFSEIVNVTGVPTLTLETGTTDATASYASGSGTTQLNFTYTVATGNNSTDLDYASVAALSAGAGSIKDSVGNSATLTLPTVGGSASIGGQKALVIDTTAPTVLSVYSDTLAGTPRGVGTPIDIKVSFSENIYVVGTPQMTLAATAAAVATYTGDGTPSTILNLTYTVAAGQNSSDLEYSSVSSLVAGTSIKDFAGNNATLTLPTPGAAYSLSNNEGIVVDTTGPSVTNVTSTPGAGTHGPGTPVYLNVTFSDPVIVTGTPGIAINAGSATASYVSGSNSNVLTFLYTIGTTGEDTSDLDYDATTSLSLNSGTIRDSLGNNATPTFVAPGAATSLGANSSVVIDTTGPTIASISSSSSDGIYNAGKSLTMSVTFNETVYVTPTPTIVLSNGDSATYTSGSGSTSLLFTYTVTTGSVASADLGAASIALGGGAGIHDVYTNAYTAGAIAAAPSLATQKAFVIVPYVATATNITATNANNIYRYGSAPIEIQVTFNEAISVTPAANFYSNPSLALNYGGPAYYKSGSGTSTLTFLYEIGATDDSAGNDLDLASSTPLTTNGLMFNSSATPVAVPDTMVFPVTVGTRSLATNKNIIIDDTKFSAQQTFGHDNATYELDDVSNIALTPDGLSIYVAAPGAASDAMGIFTRSLTSGTLALSANCTAGLDTGGGICNTGHDVNYTQDENYGVAISPDGRFVFSSTKGDTGNTTDTRDTTGDEYFIVSAVRTQGTGYLDFDDSVNLISLVADLANDFILTRDGRYIFYLSNGTVSYYSINQNTGAFTTTGSSQALANATYLTLSPDDKFLYAVNNVNSFNAYPIVKGAAAAVGAATNIDLDAFLSTTVTAVNDLIVTEDGKSLYLASNATTDAIYNFNMDLTSGLPTPSATTVNVLATKLAATTDGSFVAAIVGNTIKIYSRNLTSGATFGDLTLVETIDETGTAGITAIKDIKFSSDNKNLYYTITAGTDALKAYRLNNDNSGKMAFIQTVTGGTPAATHLANDLVDVAVSTDGLAVYTISNNDSSITQYSRDIQTGLITVGTPSDTVALGVPKPENIAISPDNSLLYLSGYDGANSNLRSFFRTPSTGNIGAAGAALSNGAGVGFNGNTSNITLPSSGEYAFIAGNNAGYINDVSIAIGTGTMALGASTAFGTPAPSGKMVTAISPDNTHLYLSYENANNVYIYTRTMGAGTIGSLQTYTSSDVRSIVIHPSGKFVYFANNLTNSITFVTRNQSTGALSAYATYANSSYKLSGVSSLVMSPEGDHLYSVSETDEALTSFSINQSTGALTFVETLTSSDVSSLNNAKKAVMSRDGKNIYVISNDGYTGTADTITVFRRF